MEAKHRPTPYKICYDGNIDAADGTAVLELQRRFSSANEFLHGIPEIERETYRFIVRACNEYDGLTKIAGDYAWLTECARKTGVTVRFVGEAMVVGHGVIEDSVVDDLVYAAQVAETKLAELERNADDPDIGAAVASLRAALAKAGA